MARVFLGLGSNIGDSKAHITDALLALGTLGEVVEVSSFYKTEPVGIKEQPWFLNVAAEFHTPLPPEELIVALKNLEVSLGREETVRFGPRVIDIDILLYDNLVIDIDELHIPHPCMAERKFVLAPLAEIAPEVVHPVEKNSVKYLFETLEDESVVEKK